jgi:hypothetical protein
MHLPFAKIVKFNHRDFNHRDGSHASTLPPDIFTDSPTVFTAASVNKNAIVLATSRGVVIRLVGIDPSTTSETER